MKTEAATLSAGGSRLADFLALTKPRLNSLVIVTSGVGYVLGSTGRFDFFGFLHTLVGSALVAGGAAALNQVAERDIDQAMERTRRRPMPTGRVNPGEASVFGLVLAAIGGLQLVLGANLLAAMVALATCVSYVAIYTPLKRRTQWATVMGAVPGALPVVIGWAAARGELGVEAWSLFGIVFLWQLPHFHALAWIYREDFRRAGLPLMAVVDRDGRRNARHALVYSLLLLPVSLTPTLIGLTGRFYAGAAFGFGVAFVILAKRFADEQSLTRARSLFVGSLVYLPLLWGLMVANSVF